VGSNPTRLTIFFKDPQITYRHASRADIERIVELTNSVWPDHLATSAEEMESRWETADPNGQVFRLVAEHDSQLFGMASARIKIRGEDRDGGWMHTVVADEWRRRGIGTRLFQDIEEIAWKSGARIMQSWSSSTDPGGGMFLEKMGMKCVNKNSESKLLLSEAQFHVFAERAVELQAAGYQFLTFDQCDTPENRRQVHALTVQADGDMPTEGTVPQPQSYEAWEKWIFHSPGTAPRQLVVAMKDNQFVGMTALGYRPKKIVFTDMTGVERDHRGKGLSGVMKLVSLKQARDDGYKLAMTENAKNNEAMLATNRRLGYQHANDTFEYEKWLTP
jgi:GNAT superfamily N-acetyltransferase